MRKTLLIRFSPFFFLLSTISEVAAQAPSSYPIVSYDSALALMKTAKYEQAVEGLNKAASHYQQKDTARYLDCLNKISECYMKLRQYDSAAYYCQKTLQLAAPNTMQRVEALGFDSFLQLVNRKLDRAQTSANAAVKLLESTVTDSAQLAKTLQVRAYILRAKNLHPLALEDFYRAKAIKEKLYPALSKERLSLYNDLGATFRYLSQYDSASSYMEKAIAIDRCHHLDNPSLYYEAGVVFSIQGQYYNALQYFEKALAIRTNTHTLKAYNGSNLLQAIGLAFSGLARYEDALTYLRKAEKVNEGIHKSLRKLSTAAIYKNIATVHNQTQAYDSAAHYLVLAASLEKQDPSSEPYLANTELYLGKTVAAKGDTLRALGHFQKAIALYRKSYGQRHAHLVKAYNSLSGLYLHQGQVDTALHYLQKAFSSNMVMGVAYPSARHALNLASYVNSLVLKGELLGKKGDINKAMACYDEAVGGIDRLLMETENKEDLLKISELSHSLYEGILALQAEDENRFESIEKAKNLLMRLNFSERKARTNAGIPHELLATEEQLRKLAVRLKTSPERNVDSLLILQKQQQDLIALFEREYQAYFDIKYNNKVISLKELQKQLPQKHLVVNYFQAENHIFMALVSRGQLHVIQVPLDKRLEENLEAFYHHLHSSSADYHSRSFQETYITLASYIYERIVAPAFTLFPEGSVDHLIIMPDGVLSYFPFELLIRPDDKNNTLTGYKDLHYLLKDFNIHYAYSATALFSPGTIKEIQPEKGLLAVAPAYGSGMENDYPLDSTQLNFRNQAYAPLLWNQQEASMLASRYQGEALIGDAAQEGFFKQHAAAYEVLHLAMHADIDEKDPMLSKLVFFDGKGHGEDGWLYMDEIFNIKLNAKLAVLSTCDSHYGKLYLGEGLFSIGRAFSYTGVPSILGTHWKIDDQVTLDVMKGFYHYLETGESKSAALRQAKLDYLNQATPIKANPLYWGSFVLVGEDEPISLQRKASIWVVYWKWILLVVVVLSASAISYRRFMGK